MRAIDFIFDAKQLSDFGFIICDLDSSHGIEEVQAGTDLTFTTVRRNKGKKYSMVDAGYGEALTSTFDICKNPCENDDGDMVITDEEFLDISRWLLRNTFMEMEIIDEKLAEPRFFNCYFNITKLEADGDVIGIRLTMTTDKPYAYGATRQLTNTFTANSDYTINNASYLIGSIPLDLHILCQASGTLTLTNSTTNEVLQVANCTSGEQIDIDGNNKIITSSRSAHTTLYDDFNYEYPSLVNSMANKTNVFTCSLASEITFTYRPIVRDGI